MGCPRLAFHRPRDPGFLSKIYLSNASAAPSLFLLLVSSLLAAVTPADREYDADGVGPERTPSGSAHESAMGEGSDAEKDTSSSSALEPPSLV